MAEVPEIQSINSEEMEDREEPMQINFEGTFHEEVKVCRLQTILSMVLDRGIHILLNDDNVFVHI